MHRNVVSSNYTNQAVAAFYTCSRLTYQYRHQSAICCDATACSESITVKNGFMKRICYNCVNALIDYKVDGVNL